jgi:hypothetical protein
MHFGAFQLTPEGMEEPVRALGNALRERGVPAERFRALEVGDSIWLDGTGGGRRENPEGIGSYK